MFAPFVYAGSELCDRQVHICVNGHPVFRVLGDRFVLFIDGH
jgi:hypothetical protein